MIQFKPQKRDYLIHTAASFLRLTRAGHPIIRQEKSSAGDFQTSACGKGGDWTVRSSCWLYVGRFVANVGRFVANVGRFVANVGRFLAKVCLGRRGSAESTASRWADERRGGM
jgi:hypothetical protein